MCFSLASTFLCVFGPPICHPPPRSVLTRSLTRTLRSTMACAALGNLFSDVIGVGMAGYIETLAKSLGVKDPLLTSSQLRLSSVRMSISFGCAVGISIGCILGMFPLLLMGDMTDSHEGGKTEKETQTA